MQHRRWHAPGMVLAAAALVAAGVRLSAPAATSAAAAASDTVVSADGCCDGPPAAPPPRAVGRRVLRVAADPNNLPFTNEKREGFENRLADLIAADLGAELEYVWRAQRRGFFRQAFKEGEANLVLGVPAGFDLATTTAPYYRSTYVFVRRAADPAVRSLDDPALKRLKLGVQLVGDDGANPPPAHALAARGIIANVAGFTVYGDYREPNPPARVVDAVAAGTVDVAAAWGPMAAYFARRQPVPLAVEPVEPAVDPVSGLPMTFAIAMGVRKGDTGLRDRLDAILTRRKAEVDAILDEYAVPRVARPAPARQP